MFARFDENPAMTLQDIKKTKRYGRTDNVKTVYPPQTKFAGGITKTFTVNERHLRKLEGRFISRIRTADNGPQIFTVQKMQVEKIDFLTHILKACELKLEPTAVIRAILEGK